MTSIVSSDDGSTHWPPTKKRSVWRTGAVTWLIPCPPSTGPAGAPQASARRAGSLTVTTTLDRGQTAAKAGKSASAVSGSRPSADVDVHDTGDVTATLDVAVGHQARL